MFMRKSAVSLLCGVFVLLLGWQIQSLRAAQSEETASDVERIKSELEAVAASEAQANERLAKLEKELADYKKTNDGKVKQLGNFNFSGDLRARYEGFFREGETTRNRERFRIRFNVTGKISDEFSGGFSIATGSLDDPVSTNQTMTGFLNRKNFGVDKAYITYKPQYAKFLKLEAGKFAFPWYRTALTFDSDVNPEGFAETLSFDLKFSVLNNITFVGFQLPFNEVSGGPDSVILGGQIQTRFQISSKIKLSLYGAAMDIKNADPIAMAQFGSDVSLKPSLNNTNSLQYNSSGSVIGYAGAFAYLDAIMKLELNTSLHFPTTIQFNFVNNMRGPRERSGYWADLLLGKAVEAKDIQFGYSIIRIEKDAVIGAWSESDVRASTDIVNHRILFSYMIAKNVTGQFVGWIGKRVIASPNESYLKRLQFDITYKF